MSVYFIQDGGPDGAIKIGTTARNPYVRLAALRTGNPRPLHLLVAIPGGETAERALHERFASARVRENGEWFNATPELLGFIAGLAWALRDDQPEEPATACEAHAIFGLDDAQLRAVAGYVDARQVITAAEKILNDGCGDQGTVMDASLAVENLRDWTANECPGAAYAFRQLDGERVAAEIRDTENALEQQRCTAERTH